MTSRRESLEESSRRRLEFPELLERIAGRASSSAGRAAVMDLLPLTAADEMRRALDETEEIRVLLRERFPFRLQDVSDITPLLALEGPVATRSLSPEELLEILSLLERSLSLGETFRGRHDLPHLNRRGQEMCDLAGLRQDLERSLARPDVVLSTASPALAEVRRGIESQEEALRVWMERKRDSSELRGVLQGNVVSIRNGRFVFAVKAEHRHRLRGVLHGESASGATLFIEPEGIVLRGNELSGMRLRERREIARILAELTGKAREERAELLGLSRTLIELDVFLARARFAEALDCHAPRLVEDRRLVLEGARHPLLLLREGETAEGFSLEGARERAVPLSLELDRGAYQMVITGPNTGGKTVVLKTVGLLVLMARCGIPVPAGEGSYIPAFDAIFADIGDEQSLQQNLSTFSSHMGVLAGILKRISSRSLVLVDELGAGTDPLEGAALGESILENLYQRGAFTLVTTHLGRLKEFAFRRRKCRNASMEFDPARLSPTYRLLPGLPGRSNALIIARRLGVPASVVDDSEKLLAGEERIDPEVLEGLERARRDLERKTRDMEKHRRHAHHLRLSAAEEARNAHDLQRALEHEAERAEEERVRKVVDALGEGLRRLGDPPRERREAFDRLLTLLEDSRRGTTLAERRRRRAASLKKGDVIFVPRLRSVCEIRKINKAKELLTVHLNGIPTEIAFNEISWVLPPPGFEAEWYEEDR